MSTRAGGHHLAAENLRGRSLDLFRRDNQGAAGHDDGALRDQKAVSLDAVVNPDATAAGSLRYNSCHEKFGYADHLGKLQFRLLTHGHPRPKARYHSTINVVDVTEQFPEQSSFCVATYPLKTFCDAGTNARLA